MGHSDQQNSEWSAWLADMLRVDGDSSGSFSRGYIKIAERVLDKAGVQNGDVVIDVGTGTGLVAFAASQRVGDDGKVIGIDDESGCVVNAQAQAAKLGLPNLVFLEGDAVSLPLDPRCADVVVCRSVLCHIVDKEAVFREWQRVLKRPGRFSFFEPLDCHDTRLSELVDFSPLGKLAQKLRAAEEELHRNPTDPLMNFDERSLKEMLVAAGFRNVDCSVIERSRQYEMRADSAGEWWHRDIGGIALPGHQSPYQLLRQQGLSVDELNACVDSFCSELDCKTISFKSKAIYMWGNL
jgi:ubiquinone/menaquinone biosynthesis C-methylase UbiE